MQKARLFYGVGFVVFIEYSHDLRRSRFKISNAGNPTTQQYFGFLEFMEKSA